MRRELKWALIGLAVLVVCSALVAPASGARYAKNLKATLQANAQESSSENSKTDGTKSEESKASTSGESSTKASESSTKATSGESSSKSGESSTKSGESSTKSGESSTKSGESSTKATSGESSTGGESSKASTSGESSKAASENSASKEGENSGPKAESSTQQAESSENSETSSGAEESTQAQESTQASEASEAAGEESGGEESSETSRDAIHDWDPSQCFKVEKKKKIIPKTFEKHPLEDSEEGGSGSGESEASCESYDKFPEAEQKPLNEVGLGFSDKMNLATPVHDKANEVAEGADAKHVQMRKDHDKNCEGGVCPKSKSGAVEATTA